jgi:hypothetical protein
MTEHDWQAVVWGLTNRDCILLIGDEATGPPGRSFRDQITGELKAALKAPTQPGLDFQQIAWLYQSEKSRNELIQRVVSFYNARTLPPYDVHAKLASLPFHCIITSSHDSSMTRALEAAAKTPRAGVYQFKGSLEQLDDAGTPDNPLVYHLFGRVETPRSLVLTEYDLVDFLVAVVAKTPPVPPVLLAELRNPDKMFLFLGFGVRNWYPRVLLHVLKMQSGNSRSFAFEEFPPPADLDRGVFFYRHGYKVEVFDEDIARFVDELCVNYKRLAPSGAARTAAATIGGPRPTAFLCHVHENAALARELATDLDAHGIDAWLDQLNLEPGARWDDDIVRRIEQVDYFIVLITTELAGRDKSYAFKELRLALEQERMYRSARRFIIPVLVGDAPMLDELRHLHQGPVRGGGQEEPVVLTSTSKVEVVQRLASSIKRDQQLRLKKGA